MEKENKVDERQRCILKNTNSPVGKMTKIVRPRFAKGCEIKRKHISAVVSISLGKEPFLYGWFCLPLVLLPGASKLLEQSSTLRVPSPATKHAHARRSSTVPVACEACANRGDVKYNIYHREGNPWIPKTHKCEGGWKLESLQVEGRRTLERQEWWPVTRSLRIKWGYGRTNITRHILFLFYLKKKKN